MKVFIGTKVVKAIPMSRLEYNDYRGWELPSDEDGSDDGYLVEYLDGGNSNHPDHAGYISWSPVDVFVKAYKMSGQLSFGDALTYLKAGQKVARKGWNGKGIFIKLQRPGAQSKMTAPYIYIDTSGLQTDNPDAPKALVPWLASQTDMLADDWCIVD
jgi:hypothetical protein